MAKKVVKSPTRGKNKRSLEKIRDAIVHALGLKTETGLHDQPRSKEEPSKEESKSNLAEGIALRGLRRSERVKRQAKPSIKQEPRDDDDNNESDDEDGDADAIEEHSDVDTKKRKARKSKKKEEIAVICSLCSGNHCPWKCDNSTTEDLRTRFTNLGTPYKLKTTTAAHQLLGTPYIPPRSPHRLVQESLYADPWKVLVACMLLNVTSGTQSRPVLLKFFDKYPDPQTFLKTCDMNYLTEIMKPLGLWKKRPAAVVRMTREFLETDWSMPSELHGIGQYGEDAYMMFCCGRWREVLPQDRILQMYHSWMKETNPKDAASEDSDLLQKKPAGHHLKRKKGQRGSTNKRPHTTPEEPSPQHAANNESATTAKSPTEVEPCGAEPPSAKVSPSHKTKRRLSRAKTSSYFTPEKKSKYFS